MKLLKNKRVQGLLLFLLGAGGLSLYLMSLVSDAKNGVEQISVHQKLIVFAVVIGTVGLTYLVFGDKAAQMLKIDPKNVSAANVFIYLSMLAIAYFSYLKVLGFLSEQGYR